MQGHHIYRSEPHTAALIDEIVPQDHFLRKIEKVLNLSFVYELTKEHYCQGNGRPSIDPQMYFRMQIILFLFNISSERKLCKDIQVNLAYRWFLGLTIEDSVPDHSSLTRIRSRLGENIFRKVFEEILRQCQIAGILRGDKIIHDATLIQANASMDNMMERTKNDPKKRSPLPQENYVHNYKTGKKIKRKYSNAIHVSKADPDCSMVGRPGCFGKLFYKSHVSIDSKSRLIIDCKVTTGAKHECLLLPERINYLLNNFHFPVLEVSADRGYGRGPTYAFLSSKGIRSYIPLYDKLENNNLTPVGFQYDRKNDRYICPKGHPLYPYEKLHKGEFKRYRVVGGHCQKCPSKENCLPTNFKNRARFVFRRLREDEICAVRRRMQTKIFKYKLKERMWKIEGIFGEAKTSHGLYRAKWRSLKNVQSTWTAFGPFHLG